MFSYIYLPDIIEQWKTVELIQISKTTKNMIVTLSYSQNQDHKSWKKKQADDNDQQNTCSNSKQQTQKTEPIK